MSKSSSAVLAAACVVAAVLIMMLPGPQLEGFETGAPLKLALPPAGTPMPMRTPAPALSTAVNRDEMESTTLDSEAQSNLAELRVGFEPLPPDFATVLASKAGGLAAYLSRFAARKHGYAATQAWLRNRGATKTFERVVAATKGTLARYDRVSYVVPRGWGEACGAVLRELDARLLRLEEHLSKGAKVVGPTQVLAALQDFNKKMYTVMGDTPVRALFAATDVDAYAYSDTLLPGEAWICLRISNPQETDADSLMPSLLHELAHVVTDQGRDALRYDQSGHDDVWLRNFQFLQKHALACGAMTPDSFDDRLRGGTLRLPGVKGRGYFMPRHPAVAASGPVAPTDWAPEAQKIELPKSGLPDGLSRYLAGTTLPTAAALAKGPREFGAAMEEAAGKDWLAALQAAATAWEAKGE